MRMAKSTYYYEISKVDAVEVRNQGNLRTPQMQIWR